MDDNRSEVTDKAPGTAEVSVGDQDFSLDVVHPVLGRPAVSIAPLGKAGINSYDPGYAFTAMCQSAITFVDGDNGILLYRGYPAQEIADACTYLDTSYLLIYGELPSDSERQAFEKGVAESGLATHPSINRLFDAFPSGLHPMAMLSALASACTAISEEGQRPGDLASVERAGIELLGAMPTFAAHAFSVMEGRQRVASDPSLGFVRNFLTMCFASSDREPPMDEAALRALETLFVLHADHEQNCSTATLRLVGSAHAGFFAGVAAAISALWGPLHGGANQAVIQMLMDIQADGGDLDKYVRKAKDSNDPFRLMGFGHRVYKTFDARAKVIRQTAIELLDRMAGDDPMLEIALRLEEIATKDEFFVQRRLYPNVDFYSGIVYRALGFPPAMFTPLFVVARVAGWVAHWRELMADPQRRIGRPSQIYVGEAQRSPKLS